MKKTSLDTGWKLLTLILLIIFSFGMLKNLGNIAFWQDEGETMQYARTILKFGYPSVFDGRSYILLDQRYDPQTFIRHWSPYLQFYLAAAALKLNQGIADTLVIRLPFALVAITGIWGSLLAFRQLKYSSSALFLYSVFLATSVQLYLYWRQARHYALHFPLGLGLLIAYLNLDRRLGRIFFLIFGFLFYHAYYPAFFSFYLAIIVHAVLRKAVDRQYSWRPLVLSSFILGGINLPVFLYLHHYTQLPNIGFARSVLAYLMDLNYFGYLKIAALSTVITAWLDFKPRPDLASLKQNLIRLFKSYGYSLSLFILIVIIHPLIASFGVRNARFVSVLFPLCFLITGVTWEKAISTIKLRLASGKTILSLVCLPILVLLITWSHPKFFHQMRLFWQELNTDYYGPVTGIVNTITGISEKKPINARLTRRPDLLIATNMEDVALYAYLDHQLLNYYAPEAAYRTGTRLPDWVIIRQDGFKYFDYLRDFLKRGHYEKIVTDYCDLTYENTYLVRTHQFKTVTDCPENQLTLYKLID